MQDIGFTAESKGPGFTQVKRAFLNRCGIKSSPKSADFWCAIRRHELTDSGFGYRLMLQVLFGEASIPLREGTLEERIEKRREVHGARRELEMAQHRQKQAPCQNAGEGCPLLPIGLPPSPRVSNSFNGRGQWARCSEPENPPCLRQLIAWAIRSGE